MARPNTDVDERFSCVADHAYVMTSTNEALIDKVHAPGGSRYVGAASVSFTQNKPLTRPSAKFSESFDP